MVVRVLIASVLLFCLWASGAAAQLPRTQCVSTAIASGTGDAIAIPLLPCTATTTVLILTITASNTTTTPTISVNGQTPYVILNFDTTALGIGVLAANQHRILTFDGAHWLLLSGAGSGGGTVSITCEPGLSCVPEPITSVGTITPERPFDIEMFWPGVPTNSAIVRAAITRSVTCLKNLPNSVGIAKEAATGSTTVNINQITSGVSTTVGTAVWSGSGTVAAFAATNNIVFAANDIVEFAFPGSADASLGDIAITLQCVRS